MPYAVPNIYYRGPVRDIQVIGQKDARLLEGDNQVECPQELKPIRRRRAKRTRRVDKFDHYTPKQGISNQSSNNETTIAQPRVLQFSSLLRRSDRMVAMTKLVVTRVIRTKVPSGQFGARIPAKYEVF